MYCASDVGIAYPAASFTFQHTDTHTPTVGNQGLNMKMEGHLWWLLSILLAKKRYQYTFFVLCFANFINYSKGLIERTGSLSRLIPFSKPAGQGYRQLQSQAKDASTFSAD